MATLIVGGGVVGLSIAYGLLNKGQDVVVFDGADDDFRASRGNFGLVWIQGKGGQMVEYSRWSRLSAALWPEYAKDLQAITGIDLVLSQKGGLVYCTDPNELTEQVESLTKLMDLSGGDYPFEVLDHATLKEMVPEIGPEVIGATYCPEDGHVNPLLLLRALSQAVRLKGGVIHTGARVADVIGADDNFVAILADGTRHQGERLVLSAGLGALDLGNKLGFATPIRAQQGQIIITEKMPPFLNYVSGTIRQVNEGGVQIGASHADVGLVDTEDTLTLAKLAQHAIQIFPHLTKAKIVRSWAALRILTPDGAPIYQRSSLFSGASFVTCHSGITLAAAHTGLLPDWILGQNTAPDLSVFSESRFDV